MPLLFLPAAAFSFQDRGLSVHFSSATDINMRPGELATLAIRVTNTTRSTMTVTARIVLPEAWRPITRDTPFSLRPSSSDTRLISFAVPHDAPADLYHVRYVVSDSSLPPNEAEASISVSVAAVRRIELRLLEAPRFVVAGAAYTSIFLLTNKGNVGGAFRLRIRSRPEFRARTDSVFVRVAPGKSREIAVRVQTDAVLAEKTRHSIDLSAVMIQDSTVIVAAESIVEVIPLVSRIEEPFHKLPARVKVRATAWKDDYRAQIHISGAGTLADGAKDFLDFSFRGPDNQAQSVLGEREEYRLRLRGVGYDVFLGDQNFQLSPLTEFGRYGLGANAQAELGRFRFGGFTNQSRFIIPLQREEGGYLGYQLWEGSRLSANFLRKRDRQESQIYSVRGVIVPVARTEFEAEYAASHAQGTTDDAYSLRATGQQPSITYDVRYILAGPKYTGYYRDLEFISAALNLLPYKSLRLEAYVRQEERNQNKDTTQFYAPRDQYIQFGASLANYLSLYYRSSEQMDLFERPKFDRKEEMVQVRLGYGFSSLNLLANVDVGTTKDKIVEKQSPFRRYSFFANLRPASSHSYGTSFEYSTDRSLFTNETQERYSASLSFWSLVADNTQLQLNVYGSRTVSPFLQTYGLVDASFDHIFSNGHRVTLRGRMSYFKFTAVDRDAAYSLEYAVPLRVPLSRKTGTGQVRGKVADVETGRGIKSVLLYSGSSTVVTDRDGNFFFPHLNPGSQFLQIDQSSIGVNRVTTKKMPIQAEIKGGEEIRVDIGVTRSASVTGTMTKYGFDETSMQQQDEKDLHEIEGLTGVILDLTNGTDVYRRVTDSRGRFVFADLLPGSWKLSVLEGQMPEYHYLESDSYDLSLKPGEKTEVFFKVLPRKRTIKIIQEGEIPTVRPSEQPPVKTPPAPRVGEKDQQPPVRAKEVTPEVPSEAAPCIITRIPDRSGYAIQISSWQSETLASRRAETMQQRFGYKTWVQKVDLPKLGTWYRVMLGVFKTREQAEEVCRIVQVEQSRQ